MQEINCTHCNYAEPFMTKEELKIKITELLPTAAFDESGEWLNINITPAEWPALAKHLFFEDALHFDFLFCLTCIDWKTHLTMVYHLTSTVHRHNIVVKAILDKNKPEIESVSSIWQTANFHEREQYEMFGVNFINHPDLRLLILPDGWEGKNPLKKDFEDPINMIRL
ncbi:MAG: NADH-quinone oxidoreductase subunit C [Ferruginibacter sp.]